MADLGFTDLNLSKEIQMAIEDMGFEETTTIQAQSIPYMLEGRDVIGQAPTGTGKTVAFGTIVLEKMDPKNKGLQAVILCPTRELAIQVAGELKKISKYKKGIEILPIYGGQPIDHQIKALKRGVQIIIGTPGRVMDHMGRRTLRMEGVKIIILDEADEMLDMGFREDIETIMKKIPGQRQTIFFSATMPKAILDLTKKYQINPQFIKLVHKEMTVPNVEQFYVEVKQQAKAEALSRLIDYSDLKLSLVFCNTKRRVDELVEELITRGYIADGLHGDMQQKQRDAVMSKFRRKEIEVLVATDVAARGIDVGDVEAVFNYDIPTDDEYYVHRIGRTARAGKAGLAFTFVIGKEVYRIKEIQKFTKTKIMAKRIPSVSDVEEVRTNLILENVKVGQTLTDYLQLNDVILEVDNKSLSHRSDLWGHYGMARELSALLDLKLKPYERQIELTLETAKADKLNVKIEDNKLCPRYLAIKLDNIIVTESPKWLQDRLLAVGQKPINNIVDAANFIMLELGQPLHTFAADGIKKIVIRTAKKEEKIICLDGQERKLEAFIEMMRPFGIVELVRTGRIAMVRGKNNGKISNGEANN